MTTTTVRRDRVQRAVASITESQTPAYRPVVLPGAAPTKDDAVARGAAAAPAGMAGSHGAAVAGEEHAATTSPGKVALEHMPHRETVIRIPHSAADVLAQLTGPELKPQGTIHRSVYFTPEVLAMVDELSVRFQRDRSALVRIAAGVLYALVTAPAIEQVDLFPVRAEGKAG